MGFSKVIVLILSYNGVHLLNESISSYLTNDYPEFKVIVIDNGSTDGTKEWIERTFRGITVLRTEKNLGYSGGFNFGLDYAFNKKQTDYVLITNNDVKADFRVISELVKVAESDPLIGFVTGKVYYYDNPDTLQTIGKHEDSIRWNGEHVGNKEIDKGQYDKITERIFADDIFMLTSKKLYLDIGGYDPTFRFQSEEYDWQARGKKLGYRIFYTPYAKIWHKDSMTIGRSSALKAYYDARNPMLVILKHKSPEFFRKYFWQHLRKDVFKSSLVSLKQLRPKVSLAIWSGFLSGIIWGLKNRQLSTRHFI
jgi:GT2 family glycosyltransferase